MNGSGVEPAPPVTVIVKDGPAKAVVRMETAPKPMQLPSAWFWADPTPVAVQLAAPMEMPPNDGLDVDDKTLKVWPTGAAFS